MRYFVFILGALLILFGIVGLAAAYHYQNFSFQQFTIGISLVVIGILTMMAAKIRYRGGLLSIIGILFLFYGLVAVADIDSIVSSWQRSAYVGIVWVIILISIGIILLTLGHRRHVRLVKQKPGNKPQDNKI
jgi:uncharacterized membrane protein YidH (DUF202 family)